MSTVEPPVTTTSKEPPPTTSELPITTPKTTEPPMTTTTTDPPVTTATTDPPVTTITTTDPPVTTTKPTDPPVTTSKPTDPPVTTTKPTDPPVTTTKDPPVRTTSTPYTTRYVTTISIVTVTTVVPEPTVISGRGTTIYVTRSTTSPVPTIIQDPTQPPPGTETDAIGKGGLQTWQITLIVVAILVMMGAVGAAVLVGRVKRRRQKRDTMLYTGDGLESVLGSEMGESGGGKSNRTLIVGGQQKHYHSGGGGVGGGLYDNSGDPTSSAAAGRVGWRERLSAWRPWDSHGSYHHQQQHPGGLEYNQGQAQGAGGGLWLMDESDPHYDRSAGAAGVAAAMRPVSYDTNAGLSGPGDTIVAERGEDPYYYGNYPYNTTQSQDSRGSLGGQTSPSLIQLERISAEEGPEYVDSHSLHRQSQEWTLSSATSTGAGIGTGGGATATGDRTMRVDPDQLESHAKFELFRKAPQAILGTPPLRQQDFEGGKSPPLPSAPPPPPSSSATETNTDTVEMLADVQKDKSAVSESDPTTTTTLLSIESTPVSKPISLVSEQQPPPQQ
ncbi:hypothetical protein BGZ97_004602 [Linnemannia gamsii]|uniref:Uncharacterized protein n=1 Tax=Linnemannia gamsii TaxID=64522 RepID=A0A9P6QU15_9FUNG|nr:hypothetical protein BGZ97_004602 [Linnemannia gamsii]